MARIGRVDLCRRHLCSRMSVGICSMVVDVLYRHPAACKVSGHPDLTCDRAIACGCCNMSREVDKEHIKSSTKYVHRHRRIYKKRNMFSSKLPTGNGRSKTRMDGEVQKKSGGGVSAAGAGEEFARARLQCA